MYPLTTQKKESLETFLGKIPDSIVKSKYEKWYAEVEPTGRITSEQMEQFLSYSLQLSVELQNFPQSFLAAAKNTPESEPLKGENRPDLIANANESIKKVKDADAPDNKEKTLHKLGIVKSEGVKKTEKAAKKDDAESEGKMREGAKLNPDKKVEEKTKTVIVNKPKGK